MAFTLAGNCLDRFNQPVAGATVDVFDTATNTLQGTGVSAGDGTYSIAVPIPGPLYAVAYLAGAPDIAGTTLDTLMATGGGAESDPVPVIF